MNRRRITLADGRYLIFYTFGESEVYSASDVKSEAEPAKPEPVPEAEEERGV